MSSNERMSKGRNAKSVKCSCKFRMLYVKDDVETDEDGRRYIWCEKCGKKIIFKKLGK